MGVYLVCHYKTASFQFRLYYNLIALFEDMLLFRVFYSQM